VTTTAARPLVGTPPRTLTWPQFEAERRVTVKQGDHQLFVGPTQSGKTVLCRINVRDRKWVVVWGTKKRDQSLDAYVNEGYVRVDAWPPTHRLDWNGKRLVRKPWNYKKEAERDGYAKLLLWPDIVNRTDLRRHRDEYAKCLDSAFIEGGWTIVIDEGLWVTSRGGLALDQELSQIAYGAASNKVSLYLCMQRPSGMSRVTWSSVSDAYVFKSGVVDDIRELASLGVDEPRDAVKVIQTQIRGHQFLHIPTRGQSKGWSISEVDPRAI
jgi:hypothetical protein